MLTVYHGSYEEVKEPSFRMCKSYTDFGLGFYVTENYEMAERWACQRGISVVNEYMLDISDLKSYDFSPDGKWLDFVVSNRIGATPDFDICGYDFLRGVAVDYKLCAVVEHYEIGFVTKETAMKLMECINYDTQICIKSEKCLENLHYTGMKLVTSERKQHLMEQDRKERQAASIRVREILLQQHK